MIRETLFEATPKQLEFIEAVLSNKYRFFLYGGAIRGGKSYVAIALLFLFCRMWPGSRWALVRKDMQTLRRNTLPTYNKLVPEGFVSPINQSVWTAKCKNGSEIIFFGENADKDPELNRWKGLEVNGFILEEANEITYNSFLKAIERAGSWKVEKAKTQPPPMIICTCNPAKNWVKSVFHDPWKAGMLDAPYFYLPAKITDNPHLPEEYVKSLQSLPKQQYRTFVDGDWDSADEPDQLIKWEWVENAFHVNPSPGDQRLGVDVARFGDDETVIAHVQGNELMNIEAFSGIDTSRTAQLVKNKIFEQGIKSRNVVIDTIGVGAGVADALMADKLLTTEFIAGAKPEGDHRFLKFKNKRSEAWWRFREALSEKRYRFSEKIREHRKLLEDLTAPRYSVSGEKVLAIESKDDIKKRLGRSTDYGDAVIQAFYESRESAWLSQINTM